ncbi:phage holin family protein [Paenibacillus humicola]|uniref:phage holin family protein n=1 Tax=Paenibacillus humicola TaxID=3110540 RepID=UPI00237BEDA2|nr:phage holin family protein [Paenibacillus humicola]
MLSQTAVSSLSAVVGAAVTFAFGGWSESLTVLLVAMAIDYITGVTAAISQKEGLSSIVGAMGLAKKGIMLLVILLAHRIDLLLGLQNDLAMGAAVYFYLANELISITENLGQIGVPLPDRLRGLIEQLKNKK